MSQLPPPTIELTEGQAITALSAKILPEDAVAPLTWSSSDATIASVNQNGGVTPLKAGTATITATAGGKSGTCRVTVNAQVFPVESISLDKSEATLTEGDEMKLSAAITPDNATNKNFSWTSSDAAIASVDNDGKVTAVKPGEATITVTTEDGGKTATCKVSVIAKVYPVEGISLNQTEISINKGEGSTLSATITPDNATNKNFSWTSSDESVATVDNDGKVTAVGGGEATITATTEDGGKTASCKISVFVPVESVTITPECTISVGQGMVPNVNVYPSDATNTKVTMTSSDETVLAARDGIWTGISVGTAILTVTTKDGGKTASCNVTVNKPIIPVEEVTLDKTELTLTEGDETTLHVTVVPADATYAFPKWSSSDENVVKVKFQGQITAMNPGEATIKVSSSDGSKSATCHIVVKDYPYVHNGHDYVDLGLTRGDVYGAGDPNASKKIVFAKNNIGAERETEFGYYFRWGEQQGWKIISSNQQETFPLSESVCVQYDKDGTATGAKWTASTFTGDGWGLYNQTVEAFTGKINQGPVNGVTYGDAATYNWGGNWRTMELEFLDMLTSNYTVPGTVTIGSVTLKKEWDESHCGIRLSNETLGTSVFFPASGYCTGSNRNYTLTNGYSMCSSPESSSGKSKAPILIYRQASFNGGNHTISLSRGYAIPVRPIAEL